MRVAQHMVNATLKSAKKKPLQLSSSCDDIDIGLDDEEIESGPPQSPAP